MLGRLEILVDSCVGAALPVLTYIKYVAVRFWSFDHSAASSLRLALNEAFQPSFLIKLERSSSANLAANVARL